MITPQEFLEIVKNGPISSIIEHLEQDLSLIQSVDEKGNTALHYAINGGNIDIIKLIISKTSNINVQNTDGETPLMFAKRFGNEAEIATLLEQIADTRLVTDLVPYSVKATLNAHKSKPYELNKKFMQALEDCVNSHSDKNLLQQAMRPTIQQFVQEFEKLGVDINSGGPRGESAFIEAIKKGQYEVVKELIDFGADVNMAVDYNKNSVLQVAAIKGYSNIASLLIDKGANVHAKNMYGTPIINVVASKGCAAGFEVLHKNGADIESLDSTGANVYKMAAENGKTDILEYLITQGFNINHKFNDDNTALHYAASNGHTATVEYLLNKGADINAKATWKGTALSMAASYRHINTALLLVKRGADIHSYPMILHSAISRMGGNELLKEALARKVNVDYLDEGCRTPLMIAAKEGNVGAINLLRQHHAEVDRMDFHGDTALIKAVNYGGIGAVKAILEFKPNPNIKDARNRTALDYAIDNYNKEVEGSSEAKHAKKRSKKEVKPEATKETKPSIRKEILDVLNEYMNGYNAKRGWRWRETVRDKNSRWFLTHSI
jgi:ankyrin repeat protein